MAKKSEVIEKKEDAGNPNVQAGNKFEKVLVENFVSLQRVMTNLVIKFDNLSNQISKLLELFEISAKTLAEKDISKEDKKMMEKLDNLLEQNKVIAKGIVLLNEKGNPPEQEYDITPIIPITPVQNIPRTPPQIYPQVQQPERKVMEGGYAKQPSAEFPKNPQFKRVEG